MTRNAPKLLLLPEPTTGVWVQLVTESPVIVRDGRDIVLRELQGGLSGIRITFQSMEAVKEFLGELSTVSSAIEADWESGGGVESG